MAGLCISGLGFSVEENEYFRDHRRNNCAMFTYFEIDGKIPAAESQDVLGDSWGAYGEMTPKVSIWRADGSAAWRDP